jgi:hypothetical protein
VHTPAKANPKPNPEAAKPMLGKTIQISKQIDLRKPSISE